jgi:hypothetical protein
MFVVKQITKLDEFPLKSFGCIIAMMKVNFYLTQTCGAQFTDALDACDVIFFLRIEEGMLRRSSVRISVSLDRLRILGLPASHSIQCLLLRSIVPERFEVVGDAEEEMLRAGHGSWPTHNGPQIAMEPFINCSNHWKIDSCIGVTECRGIGVALLTLCTTWVRH